ncbi:phosphatase PAP2 family protein [Streptomyces sp. HNM0574]|uniref:phosphatase PAP2 family protein n=1 Tax=Streptomyces sp. HNM0574 TaxID=2714954 RepID=UPI00146A56AC|nr:phosphatase PAP2 family protein [Streptomyces sp. HNM0574]NLU67972.1 phosphatase PAP2 family protein [Streptomyces sp. HNM0574]
MAFWDNPDVDLLYGVNGLAEAAPTWADRLMEYVGEYGIILALVLLGLWAWWGHTRKRPTREEAVAGFAGLVWTPLAAVVALIANIPIRGFVERPRPFFDHKGLEVLIEGKSDYSFVSDHATLAMALAVGIFLVNRKLGLIGIVLAVLAGFSRVYMGVHYPTDVIGGLALGMASALLLAPVAMWLLTPLVRAVAGSPRVGPLVWAGAGEADGPGTGAPHGAGFPEREVPFASGAQDAPLGDPGHGQGGYAQDGRPAQLR